MSQLQNVLQQRRTDRQRGDTIVEVLICIMIVSLILTGAYVTTSRSALAITNSQEHAQALKLVQSQLEQIRASAVQTSTAIFTTSTPFCMANGAPVSAISAPQDAACIVDGAGQPSTGDAAYHIATSRIDAAASSVFQVKVTWDSVTGTGQASEQISYRLYK